MHTRSLRVTLLVLAVATALLAFPAIADDDATKAQEKRDRINAVATDALNGLVADSPAAKQAYDRSYGYAVFDNWKFAFGITGGGGTGVAVAKDGSGRTFMKMGSGGVGLGLGGQKYQLIIFMETKEVFDRFVSAGWQADTQAGAAAGQEGASVSSSFRNGIALFQVTEKGLLASADVSGTKFWKHKKLN